jgi:predicted PurR-regulated permease PerM
MQFLLKVWLVLGSILLGWSAWIAQEALLVIFLGFILACALLPMVNRLNQKMPRLLAVMIPYMVAALMIFGLILPVFWIASQQLQGLLQNLPQYLSRLILWQEQSRLTLIQHWPFLKGPLSQLTMDQLLTQLQASSGSLLGGLTTVTVTASKLLMNGLTASLVSFFLVFDQQKITEFVKTCLPLQYHTRFQTILENMMVGLGGYVNGQLLIISFSALMLFTGLSLIHFPFALLFALITGVLSLIPLLGAVMSLVITLIFCLFTPHPFINMAWIVIIFSVVQAIESNVLGPWIMSKTVGLHPLAILTSLLMGGALGGLTGIVIAIPVTICIHVLLKVLKTTFSASTI